MAQEYPNLVNCLGSVLGATGATVSGSGFVSARSAKGVYTLTLDQPVNASQCSAMATVRAGAVTNSEVVIGHTSDTVKTVLTADAGVAADHNFDFVIFRSPG